MRRIASGGKSVGRLRGNHINLRHGKADFLSDPFHYAINPRQLLSRYRLCAVSGECDLVGKEVRDEISYGGDNQRPYHAALATEGPSYRHQQQGQGGE